MLKPILTYLYVVALVLVVCLPAAAENQEKVRVEAMLFDAGLGTSFFQQAAERFEAQNPGIEIDLMGDPRIVDKVRVRILEGSFPEISDAPVNYGTLIRHGKIFPLDDALDRARGSDGATWRDSFLPGSFDRYRYNGQTFGVPLWYSVYGVWYNKKLFREKGWPVPETWPELFELCERIEREGEGVAPMAFQGQYPQYLHQLINTTLYHLGGPDYLESVQQLEAGAYDHPHMVEMLRLIRRLARDHFQPGAIGMSHTQAQLEFFRGRTAMVTCGTWLLNEMSDQIPEGFEVGFFKYPMIGGPNDDPGAVCGGTGYYFVFAESENPEAATAFMRFLTSPEEAAIIAAAKRQPVAIRGVNERALPANLGDLTRVLESVERIFPAVPDDAYPAMNQAWQNVRTALLEDDAFDPVAASRELEAAAQKIKAESLDADHVTVRHRIKPLLFLGLIGAGVLYVLVTTVLQVRRAYADRHKAESGGMRIRASAVITFLLPAVLLYTAFLVIPSLSSFGWSVQRWDGLTEMEPVGILHFYRLLYEDDGFWIALGNNLFIMFVVPMFVIPLALFLATCMARGVWGSTVFRIVFFFPNLLGIAAILLWQQMYNPAGGPINAALVAMGFEQFESFAWLSQQNLYWALVPMTVWAACGFNMILYLAAMQSIPESLYEAAEIDGASAWHQFWTITIPLIWEALSVSIVFLVIAGMKAFEVIWLLTNQSPNTSTHVIGTKMVWSMFSEFRVGQAAAIAVLLFVMVFFGTAATLRLMRREAVEL
ncbi:extracellular solute-binding protein [Mucisphaera calidilacus]|uniref:Multiple sugar-binding protein n=1 Tax=Mucisphaera calidilacus TaxID=2527982 RepID=A0A518BV63_9BACT|nr:extracellular solute-binding protein [Mucisphaera calidilacus]QDU70868.1 Multiple sugar-binding protein precursor [Mucisphaera calidilacus]